jgi:hypothetical protein
MTKAEWFAATDWQTIHHRVLRRKCYDRKIRLFSVACCRRIAHMFKDAKCDEAVDVCELFADGEVSQKRLKQVEKSSHTTITSRIPLTQAWARDAAWRTSRVEEFWEGAESCLRAVKHKPAEVKAQTELFRDIFRNPFQRAKREQAWLTTDALLLAQGIYADRAFDRMPILADALQDAGCNNEEVLHHCRDANQVHVRGCWVVDLLLGKE